MLSARGSNRRSRIVAIPRTLVVVGVTAWFIAGCSQDSQKPAKTTTKTETATKTTSENTDGDVHVKVDLPDTVTIKP